MLNGKEWLDRRKYTRWPILTGAFVVIKYPNAKVGQIIDISIDGLAFHYVGKEKEWTGPTELSIFSGDGAFCLYRVPCKVISDLSIQGRHFDAITRRRCAIQFGDLTPGQMSQLESFIQNHTDCEMSALDSV
jgi:hypothetical protein